MTTLANETAGINRGCPTCGAEPGESCTDRHGRTRFTTHVERKDGRGTDS